MIKLRFKWDSEGLINGYHIKVPFIRCKTPAKLKSGFNDILPVLRGFPLNTLSSIHHLSIIYLSCKIYPVTKAKAIPELAP